MIIRDYIKAKFSLWSVELSDEQIDLEIVRLGLDPSETITEEINLDLFFYTIIPDILLTPTNVSEGGFSISFDKSALLKYYSMLAKKLRKQDLLSEKSTIKDITNQW